MKKMFRQKKAKAPRRRIPKKDQKKRTGKKKTAKKRTVMKIVKNLRMKEAQIQVRGTIRKRIIPVQRKTAGKNLMLNASGCQARAVMLFPDSR